MKYDTIVVGLGVIGSSTALQLARLGEHVLALERFTPVHDNGASHGETRCIFRTYFMGPRYAPLVNSAYEMWAEISEESGIPLLTRTGALLLSSGTGRLVKLAQATAELTGAEHELFDAAALRQRFPQLTPSDDTVALHDPDGGFIRAEQSVRAFLELAGRAGAALRFSERVHHWTKSASGMTVTTGRGIYHADKLAFCAGAWVNQLLPGVPVRILRKAQVWLSPSSGQAEFTADRFPFWAWDNGAAIATGFPIVAAASGAKVAFHTGGDPCDPDHTDRMVRSRDVAELRDFLRSRIPALGTGRHVRGETCLYDVSPDQNFIVGQVPGEERVFMAAGTSGHAFKFAPVLGRALAELAVHGRSSIDIGVFTPDRVLQQG